ncbi:MAG: hypothetical protein IKU77_05360 [Alistipes sp.]|nr:hypothetical protein [Alistipes sp.]
MARYAKKTGFRFTLCQKARIFAKIVIQNYAYIGKISPFAGRFGLYNFSFVALFGSQRTSSK